MRAPSARKSYLIVLFNIISFLLLFHLNIKNHPKLVKKKVLHSTQGEGKQNNGEKAQCVLLRNGCTSNFRRQLKSCLKEHYITIIFHSTNDRHTDPRMLYIFVCVCDCVYERVKGDFTR